MFFIVYFQRLACLFCNTFYTNILFFLTNNQITTGAPNSDVIAFIGSVNSLVGSCAIMSHINKTIAPIIATAGNNILWFELENDILAMCGTAKPTKAIGPEKAVITPVKRLVISKIIFSTLLYIYT